MRRFSCYEFMLDEYFMYAECVANVHHTTQKREAHVLQSESNMSQRQSTGRLKYKFYYPSSTRISLQTVVNGKAHIPASEINRSSNIPS